MKPIEERLKEYRLEKQRKNHFKTERSRQSMPTSTKFGDVEHNDKASDHLHGDSCSMSNLSTPQEIEVNSEATTKFSWNSSVLCGLYVLLWITLLLIAIELEFGVIYIIVSALYFIWINTRTGPKKEGEISAYSVFNPNCEAIDGTLKAEQFEQEIRYGAGSFS